MSATQGSRLTEFARSYAAKIALLVVVFFAMPLLIYHQFLKAEEQRREILLESMETQGRLIARSIRPRLEAFDGRSVSDITEALLQLKVKNLQLKLLLRPEQSTGPEAFYYIASVPMVSKEYFDQERKDLIAAGILSKVQQSCEIGSGRAMRYENPDKRQEIVTSVTPVHTESGCWVLITSTQTESLLNAPLERRYWKRPEVLLAGGLYITMALLVLWLFANAWSNLRNFASLARSIRSGNVKNESFAKLNRVPELSEVAAEFDHLVLELQDSAYTIKHAAEENAHAFKTPIAVIAQSLEPLKQRVARDDAEQRRAIDLIEGAVERLDALVSAARRLDEVLARALQPSSERIDLSTLLLRMLDGYTDVIESRRLHMKRNVSGGVFIRGDEEMAETVVENLLENAIDFSPEGGALAVTLSAGRRGFIELIVEDEGPGIEASKLDAVFERYVSLRPRTSPSAHFGLGLWIVRRNVRAMGGSVMAENRQSRGLRMTVTLPHVS